MIEFNGKVALVTGATFGIGRATALAFAKAGAKVVAAGRREEQGDETVRLIRQAGGQATFVRTDVRVDAEVRDLIDRTVSTYGRLDCAIFQLPRCAATRSPTPPISKSANGK